MLLAFLYYYYKMVSKEEIISLIERKFDKTQNNVYKCNQKKSY